MFDRLRSIPDAVSTLLDIAKALQDYRQGGLTGRMEIDDHAELIFCIRAKKQPEQEKP